MVGRESPYSLYDQDLVTFEEGAVAYDHRDAAGFIKLNALRLRTLGAAEEEAGAVVRQIHFITPQPCHGHSAPDCILVEYWRARRS